MRKKKKKGNIFHKDKLRAHLPLSDECWQHPMWEYLHTVFTSFKSKRSHTRLHRAAVSKNIPFRLQINKEECKGALK